MTHPHSYNDFISWGKQQSWSKTPSTSIATAQANYTAFKQLTTYQQQGLSYTISTMVRRYGSGGVRLGCLGPPGEGAPAGREGRA